jgi:hypothetical protein
VGPRPSSTPQSKTTHLPLVLSTRDGHSPLADDPVERHLQQPGKAAHTAAHTRQQPSKQAHNTLKDTRTNIHTT